MSLLTPLQTALSAREPALPAKEALARANSNAGHNVYLALDPERVLAEATALTTRFPDPAQRPPLFGVPIGVKDCFDVAGYPTTCGSHFYAEKNGIVAADSAVAARLRQAGAVIMGKTHLHQLAYGITGENSEYGDCVQPENPQALTGGSSSGSSASVQEGSAVASIGTDTGGSIRVPAALCGLAGYRSTLGLGGAPAWEGGFHLAVSFDTLGWLFRDLRDGPALAAALLDVPVVAAPQGVTIAAVGEAYLHDCEPAVLEMYRGWQTELRGMAPRSASSSPISGPIRGRYLVASRHTRRPRCIADISNTLNPRSGIGSLGALRSPTPPSRICASATWCFAGSWISCCNSMTFSCCRVHR